jgi:hypothetical protein
MAGGSCPGKHIVSGLTQAGNGVPRQPADVLVYFRTNHAPPLVKRGRTCSVYLY